MVIIYRNHQLCNTAESLTNNEKMMGWKNDRKIDFLKETKGHLLLNFFFLFFFQKIKIFLMMNDGW
jgi:hypothetical protein